MRKIKKLSSSYISCFRADLCFVSCPLSFWTLSIYGPGVTWDPAHVPRQLQREPGITFHTVRDSNARVKLWSADITLAFIAFDGNYLEILELFFDFDIEVTITHSWVRSWCHSKGISNKILYSHKNFTMIMGKNSFSGRKSSLNECSVTCRRSLRHLETKQVTKWFNLFNTNDFVQKAIWKCPQTNKLQEINKNMK